MTSVSCIERYRIDDLITWLEEDEVRQNNCDYGLLFDICKNVSPKVRCSPRIALEELLLLSEQAGYNVNRAAVSERTKLVVEDIHRLAKKANYSQIVKDLRCFQTSICSVDKRTGFRELAEKTRHIASNLRTADCHNTIDKAEYLAIENEAAFLDGLGREMCLMILRRLL